MATEISIPNTLPPVEAKLLIDGEWVEGVGRSEIRNPAHPGELVGTAVSATPEEVNQAIAAANAAYPAWAARSYGERARDLAKALNQLETNIDERAILYSRENGKTVAEAKGELMATPARQKVALELAEELDRGRTSDGSIIRYAPYGVVVSIVPWNAPVALGMTQIFAAMLGGNAVVLKPPVSCPLTMFKCFELMVDSLPPGVLNLVTGSSAKIGDVLTTHPDVGKIGFVGSITSARKLLAKTAATIKSATLELGGNDAAILLDDVDLGEDSMDRMANATFAATGQICMAVKRIYVPESIKDQFIEAFTASVDKIVVGDGLKPGVSMGPLHLSKALDSAMGYVADSEKRGATVNRVGTIDDPDTFSDGYFMQPTIVSDIEDDALLMVEEQFCPALPIATYTDIDDAVARANDSLFGLGGSVWSKNLDRAVEVMSQVECGTAWINTHGTRFLNIRAPYGGFKQSGIGCKSGIEGIEEYMQRQTITFAK